MALLSVADALHRILAGVTAVGTERVSLSSALGRVLSQQVIAGRDQPPFSASAMDGYAVRHTDVTATPATLKVVGVSAAGHGYRKALKPGQAVRILTGAPLPKEADTIVVQENTARDGESVLLLAATPAGKHVRRPGLDFTRGDVLLEPGTRLRARDIGLAAAGNAPMLHVRKKVRVALFATGDELVLPGNRAGRDQIYSSNNHAIAALAEGLGATVSNLGIVRDTLAATQVAVRKGLKADILVTTGGASVGDHDFVQEAFKDCGVKIAFWKIAMRPGKPFMYGRKGKCHVMGLPGNPVSALVTARLFLQPLIRALEGLPQDGAALTARLEAAMPENDSRQDYVRASMEIDEDGRRSVSPFRVQDSSQQQLLQQAQCLIIRPPHAPAAAAGDVVAILPLDF